MKCCQVFLINLLKAIFRRYIVSRKPFVLELQDNNEYQQLLEGYPQTCGMRSGRVYLTQGQSCGEHSTGAHEEILVFLSGHGISLIGREKKALEVGSGKVIYIPPDTLHNIENPNSDPLVYIYCVAPAKVDSEDSNQ